MSDPDTPELYEMPHNLAVTNGRHAMAYFGEVPWHGLGTKLLAPATAAEAISAAGMDYEVQLTALQVQDGPLLDGRKAVVRNDTKQVLGVVSDRYVPVQNRHCFGFLDAVVAEGQVRYHTAGALGKGERIWLLAKLPDHIRVKGSDDVVDKFLLLSNTHDGSAALRVFFTPIRVVCQNTFNLAERRSLGSGISIQHKGDLTTKIREAQRVLGLAERFYDDAAVKIDVLAGFQPSSQQLQSYFAALYPDLTGAESTRTKNIRERLTDLFEVGVGQDIPEVRHSMWAAVNAVTEYVDHHRSTKSSQPLERAQRRLESAWFGSGSRLKAKAWRLALDLVA